MLIPGDNQEKRSGGRENSTNSSVVVVVVLVDPPPAPPVPNAGDPRLPAVAKLQRQPASANSAPLLYCASQARNGLGQRHKAARVSLRPFAAGRRNTIDLSNFQPFVWTPEEYWCEIAG